jgi:hypothetical protein
MDLIDFQEGRGDIPNLQVGKGEEDMSSNESSCQQGVLMDGEKAKERSHPYEDSCKVVSCVNEDDSKLENFITKEED